jgi:hypothetical protein
MELPLSFLSSVVIWLSCFFAIGFVLTILCWPINDDQSKAPLWLVFAFIKSTWRKLLSKKI